MAETLPFLDPTGRYPRVPLSSTLDLNLSYYEKPVPGRENTIFFSSMPSTLSSTWGELYRGSCLAGAVTFSRGTQPNSSPGLAEEKSDKYLDFPFFSPSLSLPKLLVVCMYTGSRTHWRHPQKPASSRAQRREEIRRWSHGDKGKTLS